MQNTLLRTNKEIEEIYSKYIDTLYRVCFTYLKSQADAEDAVQTTFIKYMHCTKGFENAEHQKAWLITTASNTCKDILKSSWKKLLTINEHENDLSIEPFESDSSLVLQAVLDLPLKYRTVIYLHYYEGYNCNEIAKMIKKRPSTVRNYLHEAREKLKNKLGGDFDAD